jgi:hypothetical protein
LVTVSHQNLESNKKGLYKDRTGSKNNIVIPVSSPE